MSQAAVRQQIVNYLLSKSEGSQASVLGTAPTLPVTITYGVDDQFVYTPVSTGTPETFTVAPGVYSSLVRLAGAMSESLGASLEAFSTIVNVDISGDALELVMLANGASHNGDTITEGNGAAALLGLVGATFVKGITGDSTIPFLNAIFGFPPKFTPEGDILPSDNPGIGSGVGIFLYIPDSKDQQIEFRGKVDPGGKRVNYELHLICVMFSEKSLSQDAGADNESFTDGLKTAIRASKNCGGVGPVFQWGQGDMQGGQDIIVKSDLPKQMGGKQGKTMIYSLAQISVIELLTS